jgi:predicted kinase
VLIVTGLPATGKTTLARALAVRYGAPLIAKDLIKEPLLDVLGGADATASRALSDASFAVLFAIAAELRGCGSSMVLEGNFRPAEHAAPLASLIRAHDAMAQGSPAECAQVLCRIAESERLRRLEARAADPARHPGHRDAAQAAAARQGPGAHGGGGDTRGGADYLDLPGERFLFTGLEGPGWPQLLEGLDRWWHSRGPVRGSTRGRRGP